MQSSQGVLADAYGAMYAGGQRFFSWTNDAFNPTAFGVQTRILPSSAPELVGSGIQGPGGNSGLSSVVSNPWSLIQSPVVWVILALVIGFPLYHWYEYGKK